MNLQRGALRTEVYSRLERERPSRWEGLRGCTVKHRVFGEGTISRVMMPDWSNPVHLAVTFGQREKVFHLSSFGDRTMFPESDLPDQLAAAIANAEQEIATEESRLEEDLQRRDREAREAVARRHDRETARLTQQRQAAVEEAAALQAQAEAWLAGICAKVDHDQPLTETEMRLLLANQRHELLLGYYERSYARTGEYRAIVKAATTWRAAKHPAYALRVTGMLLDSMDRLCESARAAVLTLRGEAFLDLHRLVEAKESALQAIASAGNRPQPYQLLGAILMESGDTADGELHFARARQLAGVHGAPRLEKAQQAAIKKQLQSHLLDSAGRKALAQDLLRIDPRRYLWVEAYLR